MGLNQKGYYERDRGAVTKYNDMCETTAKDEMRTVGDFFDQRDFSAVSTMSLSPLSIIESR